MGVNSRAKRDALSIPDLLNEGPVDFDLHGVIGVRLIDPSPEDVTAVTHQIGQPQQRPLGREPDIRIRFVRRIPTPDLRYVGAKRNAFTEDGLFLVVSGSRSARVHIPFEAITEGSEIVCERGIGSIPLLADILKLVALKKGLVPLHASAFNYRGIGVLLMGWAHGGKTSALLAFTEQGAQYVGDDLVLLALDGQRMFGIDSPIDLTDWQLRQIPRARDWTGLTRRIASGGVNWLDRLQREIPSSVSERMRPLQLLRAAIPPLQRRLRVSLPASVVCPGAANCVSELDKLFFMVTHESAEIRVEPADPEEMLQRTFHLARYEGLTLLGHYIAYQFAFPGRTNKLIECAHETEVALLRKALSGKEAHVVYHPRPVSLRELYNAMEPVCKAVPMTAAAAAESE